jgi:hypothetical protein
MFPKIQTPEQTMPIESTIHNKSHTNQKVLKNASKNAVVAMAIGEKK